MVKCICMYDRSHPHTHAYNCHSGLWERVPLMKLIASKCCYMTPNQCTLILPLKMRPAIGSAIRYAVLIIKKTMKKALKGEGKCLRKRCQEEPMYFHI